MMTMPRTSFTLRPHQMEGVETLTSDRWWALRWLVGSGKTLTTLESFRILKERGCVTKLLVVARKMGKLSWIEDIHKFQLGFSYSDITKKNFDPDADIWLIHRDVLHDYREDIWKLCEGKKVMMVFDEFHAFRNPGAQRSIAAYRLSVRAERIVGLTATPFDKREQIWFLLKILRHPNPDTEWGFRRRFCIMKDIRLKTGRVVSVISGYKNEEWWKCLVKMRMSHFDGPLEIDQRLIPLYVELTPQQKVLYKSACEGVLNALPNWNDLTNMELYKRFQSNIESRIRLQQILSNPRLISDYSDYPYIPAKYAALKDFLENFMDETDEKIIVWTHFKGHMDYLPPVLAKFKPLTVGYRETEKQRNENFYKFKEDPASRLLIMSIGIGGESLNLQVANNSFYLEIDPLAKLIDWIQTKGRTYRLGQERNVRYYVAQALHTFDEMIFKYLLKKEKESYDVIGGEMPIIENLKDLFTHFKTIIQGG